MNPETKETINLIVEMTVLFTALYAALKLIVQRSIIERYDHEKAAQLQEIKRLQDNLKEYELVMRISDDISAEMFKENEKLNKLNENLKKLIEDGE